ncbi:MAG: HAD family hydrolase [Paracoccaceae bacterium]
MTIQAVVFDIGNVLIEWHPEKFYDGLIGAERRKALFAEVDLDGMNLSVDLGAPFKKTVMAKADEHPEWRDEIVTWHDRWIDMCSPEIPHSIRLLRALRSKGVPVFALSNFGTDTFEFASTRYPVLHEFDRPYISGYLEMIKPDAAFYQHLEDDSGLSGDALLFADDRPDNIDAALARGWKAHLFEHPQGWADRLVAEGLLTEAEAA